MAWGDCYLYINFLFVTILPAKQTNLSIGTWEILRLNQLVQWKVRDRVKWPWCNLKLKKIISPKFFKAYPLRVHPYLPSNTPVHCYQKKYILSCIRMDTQNQRFYHSSTDIYLSETYKNDKTKSRRTRQQKEKRRKWKWIKNLGMVIKREQSCCFCILDEEAFSNHGFYLEKIK